MVSATVIIFILSLLNATCGDVTDNPTAAEPAPTEAPVATENVVNAAQTPDAVPTGEATAPIPDHVLALTTDTFPTAILTTELIFVEFYAPWCGHCKSLDPEYRKAAAILNDENSPIKLAKIDGTAEPTVSTQYDIQGYPTLKLFRNSVPIDYSGGRTAEDIVAWLKKKLNPPVQVLGGQNTAEALIDGNNVTAILYVADKDSPLAKNFSLAADTFDDIAFGLLSDVNEFPKSEVEDGSLVLYKKYDEPKTAFSGNSTDIPALQEFLRVQSHPLISELNEKTSQKIFESDIKLFLLLFISKAADGLQKIVEPAKEVAKNYRGQIFFISVDSDDESNQQMMTFFGADAEDVPCMRLIRVEPEMTRFKPETNDLTPEAIKNFVDSYFAAKLTPIKDEYQEEDWNLDPEPVKTLYANNFEDVVYDTNRDVLVQFYSPTCDVCKKFALVYEQLGEAYKDKSSVVIARIDAVENPLEDHKITDFPTLKLYTRENHVIDYKGDRTLRDLILFLEANFDRHYEKQYDDYRHDDYGHDEYEEDDRFYRDEL